MQVVRTVRALREARAALRGTVGFVPTMGALHAGHLSLARLASQQCDHVVTSIFVNPKQFAAHEDLDKYPQQQEQDIQLLSTIPKPFSPDQSAVDIIFIPNRQEMYPNGSSFKTFVDQEGVNEIGEGKSRPGFFRGVCTVVAKLFNLVQPDRAFFGQKDAMQCAVIRTMVRDLNFPIEIVVGETMREKDGLAMSSRNAYLSPTERAAAPILYKSLQAARDLYLQHPSFLESSSSSSSSSSFASVPSVSRSQMDAVVRDVLKSEPLISKVHYVSLSDPITAEEIEFVPPPSSDPDNSSSHNLGAVLSSAITIGSTRLIDNIILPPLKPQS